MISNNKGWETDALLFEKTRFNETPSTLEAIKRLKLKGNEKVLDLGCGSGLNTFLMQKQLPNGHVTGIDLSRDLINRAKLKSKGINNISFIIKNALDIDFEEEFDAIFSDGLMVFIKDIRPLLSLVYKSLKNNGRVMFKNHISTSNMDQIIYHLMKLTRKKEYRPFFKNFTEMSFKHSAEKYRKIMEAIGFKHISIEPFSFKKFSENVSIEDILNFHRASTLPLFIHHVPIEHREEYINDFDSIIKKFPSFDTTLHKLFIYAIKKFTM